MTHADALQLHGELTKLASRPPGADEEGKKKMNQILFRFSCDTDCGGYLREKASEVGSFLDPWLSARKWQRWGDDPSNLRAILNQCLYKLKRAIDQDFAAPQRSSN